MEGGSDKLITWMDLHLSGNPLPVKMGKPPASNIVHRVRSDEWDSEISLVSGGDGLLGSLHCGLPRLLDDGGRSSHLLVKRRVLLLVSRLPGVVNLQAPVELLPTGLWNSFISPEVQTKDQGRWVSAFPTKKKMI